MCYIMTRLALVAALCISTLGGATEAEAALNLGDRAPDFTTEASLGGNEFTFKLADALKTGPVVLYFYPAAFTSGCTVEAHAFAEATDHFKELGATVIGMSRDNIDTLKKFSTSECRSKFAVGAADSAIVKGYDVSMMMGMMTNRTSYVIAPDGKVIGVYSALDPDKHVAEMTKVVEAWREQHRAN